MIRTTSILAASLLALQAGTARPAAAQQAAPQRSPAVLVVGGILGGAAGIGVGGVTGALIGGNSCIDDGNPDSCRGLEGFVIGALSGQSLGIPLGVHIANRRQGSLAPSVLASALIAVAGAVTFSAADSKPVMAAAVVSVPVLQLVSSIAIERKTARRRQR